MRRHRVVRGASRKRRKGRQIRPHLRHDGGVQRGDERRRGVEHDLVALHRAFALARQGVAFGGRRPESRDFANAGKSPHDRRVMRVVVIEPSLEVRRGSWIFDQKRAEPRAGRQPERRDRARRSAGRASAAVRRPRRPGSASRRGARFRPTVPRPKAPRPNRPPHRNPVAARAADHARPWRRDARPRPKSA